MEVHEYIKQTKNLQDLLLTFIASQNRINELIDEYQALIDFLQKHNYGQNKKELQQLLSLLCHISNNHCRTPDFFEKIEQIILYLRDSIKQNLSDSIIFNLFKKNKRILLFLFEKEIIPIKDFIPTIQKSPKDYRMYFYNIINPYLDKDTANTIKSELLEIDSNILQNFEHKQKEGENNSYIANLIRSDSIEEFITYVNQTNLSLTTKIISPSIFETNPLLREKKVSLIEYACLYGSIQIFQFLVLNQVPLTTSLWYCVIHSNNAELIHLLEEHHVRTSDGTYEKCLEESIKCHHNDISNYIINSLLKREIEGDFSVYKTIKNVLSYSFKYCNYALVPDNLDIGLVIHYSFHYDNLEFVDFILRHQIIIWTNITIQKKNFFLFRFKKKSLFFMKFI
ncbi:hypothetical protein M9Y10_026003 [Tritrichomonas musculus]|uniref:DUF3447 domain-containing protein n=1 Tax=Tritrichomonas musculus TaxID=1915356 RepID=A0ABR2HAK0_9EUKA